MTSERPLGKMSSPPLPKAIFAPQKPRVQAVFEDTSARAQGALCPEDVSEAWLRTGPQPPSHLREDLWPRIGAAQTHPHPPHAHPDQRPHLEELQPNRSA